MTGSQRPILVIHPGALGDVLQTVPALRALRARGPLTFAGQPRLGNLLCGLALVDAAWPFDGLGLQALFTLERPPSALVERLARFDRIVSWFGSRDETYSAQLRAIARDCVIAPPVPGDENREPVWRHLLATIDDGEAPDIAPLDVPAPWHQDGQRALTKLGAARGRPLLLVHPGAGAQWKLWPAGHQARVIREVTGQTGAQPVIHEGPADREIVEALLRVLDGDVLHLVQPELPRLAAILARSVYLGVDSGVSHLAAAMGARGVVLYPSATQARWESWSQTVRRVTIDAEADQIEAVATALIEEMRLKEGEAD